MDFRRNTPVLQSPVYSVLPNGKGIVGDWLMPQIDKAYESHEMPTLLSVW
jgi:hypothetical protein